MEEFEKLRLAIIPGDFCAIPTMMRGDKIRRDDALLLLAMPQEAVQNGCRGGAPHLSLVGKA